MARRRQRALSTVKRRRKSLKSSQRARSRKTWGLVSIMQRIRLKRTVRVSTLFFLIWDWVKSKIKLIKTMAIHSQSLNKISAELIKTNQNRRRTMQIRVYNEMGRKHKLKYRRTLKRLLPLPWVVLKRNLSDNHHKKTRHKKTSCKTESNDYPTNRELSTIHDLNRQAADLTVRIFCSHFIHKTMFN